MQGVDECCRTQATVDGTVLVVDGTGHWETLGTAELLRMRGATVHVICSRPVIGSACDTAGRVLWHRRAIERGIILAPNVELLEIVPAGGYVRDLLTGTTFTIAVDRIVPVYGRRSREDLYLRLLTQADRQINVIRIGDCVAPRLLQHAINDGEAALTASRQHATRHSGPAHPVGYSGGRARGYLLVGHPASWLSDWWL